MTAETCDDGEKMFAYFIDARFGLGETRIWFMIAWRQFDAIWKFIVLPEIFVEENAASTPPMPQDTQRDNYL